MGVIGVGATALLVGLAVLLAMVRYDLGPRARLERGGWWLLATGMAAFALKLGIILALANLPGAPITIDRITAVIAAYERTLITPDAPYDRFVRGELDALTPTQLRGMAPFQSVGCVLCHSGPNFSAASVFEPQAPLRIFPAFPTPYETRYGLTGDSGAAPPGSPRGSWRVPSLRNVALTDPWFHNGSVTELEEAVRLMANVQLGRTGHLLIWSAGDRVLREVDRPELGEREIGDLVAFLHALSSDRLAERTEGAGKTPPGAVSYPSAGAAPRAR